MTKHVFYKLPSDGDDRISAGSGDDYLFGFSGDDTIYGGGGGDVFFDGVYIWPFDSTGPFVLGEVYDFGAGSDSYYGGDGIDWLDWAGLGQAIAMDWSGGRARIGRTTDRFSGIEGFYLGAGDDTIEGFLAGSLVDGNAGYDRLDLSAIEQDILIDLSQGGMRLENGKVAWLDNIEEVVGPDRHSALFVGNDLANVFFGGREADGFSGLGAADRFYGNGGGDIFEINGAGGEIYGGNGQDSLSFRPSRSVPGVIYLDGAAGTVTIGDAVTTFSSIEHFAGSGRREHFTLLVPKLDIDMGKGNDTLASILAGATLNGGAGLDVLDLSHETGGLLIDLEKSLFRSAGGKAVSVSNFEEYHGAADFGSRLLGSKGADHFIGGDAGDKLDGRDGNDLLEGGDGADRLFGGSGRDSLFGGEGNDVLIDVSDPDGFSRGEIYGEDGNDYVETAIGMAYGGEGSDVLHITSMQAEGASIYGGAGDDRLFGRLGNASGGDGDDTLQGTRLFGDAGDDRLIASADGPVWISGGEGDDLIDLGRAAKHEYEKNRFYGGDGDDVFLAKSTAHKAPIAALLYGGDGIDTLHVMGDLLGNGRVMEIERVIGSDMRDVVRVQLRSESLVRLEGGDDDLSVMGYGGTVELGAGADEVEIKGGNHVVHGDLGDDVVTVAISRSAHLAATSVYGDGGDDIITVISERGVWFGTTHSPNLRVYGGEGDDRIDGNILGRVYGGDGDDEIVSSTGTFWSTEPDAIILAEDGNDYVELADNFVRVILGAGDDVLKFSGRLTAEAAGRVITGDIRGGAGADIYDLRDAQAVVDIRILDFQPGEDRIRSWAGSDLASWDRVEQQGDDVVMYLGRPSSKDPAVHDAEIGQTVTLVGLDLADLDDGIFL